MIYEQGMIGGGVYYVHRGFVKIVSSTVDGQERILDLIGPGEIFGEQTLDTDPYFSSAVALEDCVIYYLSCQQLYTLASSRNWLLDLLVHSIVQKMRLLADEILLRTFSAEQQLAYSLLKLSQRYNHTHQIPLTQKEISNYTGLTRITVYKILKKWSNEELVEVRNRCFVIKNPTILENYVRVS